MHSDNIQLTLDTGGDTDPATDIEDAAAIGMKRKVSKSSRPTPK